MADSNKNANTTNHNPQEGIPMSDEIAELLRDLITELQESNQHLSFIEDKLIDVSIATDSLKDDVFDIKWDINAIRDNQP